MRQLGADRQPDGHRARPGRHREQQQPPGALQHGRVRFGLGLEQPDVHRVPRVGQRRIRPDLAMFEDPRQRLEVPVTQPGPGQPAGRLGERRLQPGPELAAQLGQVLAGRVLSAPGPSSSTRNVTRRCAGSRDSSNADRGTGTPPAGRAPRSARRAGPRPARPAPAAPPGRYPARARTACAAASAASGSARSPAPRAAPAPASRTRRASTWLSCGERDVHGHPVVRRRPGANS